MAPFSSPRWDTFTLPQRYIFTPALTSQYRTFKAYYLLEACRHLASDFPNRLSYNRLVAVVPTVLVPLCVYLHTRKGQATGIGFIDATSLVVCHKRRIYSHKVFKQIARRGKTSVGWFYGFKLYLEPIPVGIKVRNPRPRIPDIRLKGMSMGLITEDDGWRIPGSSGA